MYLPAASVVARTRFEGIGWPEVGAIGCAVTVTPTASAPLGRRTVPFTCTLSGQVTVPRLPLPSTLIGMLRSPHGLSGGAKPQRVPAWAAVRRVVSANEPEEVVRLLRLRKLPPSNASPSMYTVAPDTGAPDEVRSVPVTATRDPSSRVNGPLGRSMTKFLLGMPVAEFAADTCRETRPDVGASCN